MLYEQETEPWPTKALEDELASLMWAACDAVTAAMPSPPPDAGGAAPLLTATHLMEASLAVEVLAMALVWGHEDRSDRLAFGYHQITPAVPPLVDVQGAGESPFWERSHLYGSRWGHFGAFGSDDWRASDWLWGRLDGARQLIELLVPDDPDARRVLLTRMGEAILADEDKKLGDVRDSALLVQKATAGTLWVDFAKGLDAGTREAIVSKLERLPTENLTPEQGRLALAALGRNRPSSDAKGWMARRAENTKLRAVRLSLVLPRKYLHKKIKKALSGQ